MHWDDWRFFLALVRKRSVRAAAGHLGVSHSTVLRRIEGLEHDLGLTLFDRQPDGFILSGAGSELVHFALRIEAEMDGLERAVAGRSQTLSGVLRVTMADLLATRLLVPVLARFAGAYPGIELELLLTYEHLNLTRREADVAVRLTHAPPEDLIGRRLCNCRTAVYAARHLVQTHDPSSPDTPLTWLGWQDLVPFPDWVKESPYPHLPVRHQLNNALLQVAAAKAGLGLALIPCFLGDAEPDLVRLPPGHPLPGYDIWLLTHRDLRNSARVRAFLDFLAEAIVPLRPTLMGTPGAPETGTHTG